MAAHADIDMISITGSNRAGALVAQAAAPTVKRVTQELGGKSPNLLLPDADFAKAVPLGVMSAFRNVGQSCSAPTRMIVPKTAWQKLSRWLRQPPMQSSWVTRNRKIRYWAPLPTRHNSIAFKP